MQHDALEQVATSDDGGPFVLESDGGNRVLLSPEDTFSVDGNEVLFHVSQPTLDSRGASFFSVDLQSHVIDDTAGVSVGDEVRNIPWSCD